MFKYVLILHGFFLMVASAAPEALSRYLPVNEYVKGHVGVVLPPEGVKPYMKRLEQAASKNPKWFKEYDEKTKPGVPFPYHENLGLTKKEYEDYLSLLKKRVFKPLQPVSLRLEEISDGEWMIRVGGPGFPISALRYDLKKNEFRSPNGTLGKGKDINAEAMSLLGSWKGASWIHESATTISKTHERLGIGEIASQKTGYLIYRIKEESKSGRPLYDKSIIIQFPVSK